ncbi:MAG: hypothetical protein RJA59_1386 [Pseudomonadota bacterium]
MAHYDVEGHDVVVWERRSRWTAVVDHVPVPGWFLTEAEAWTAGVREALGAAVRRRKSGPSMTPRNHGGRNEEGRPE